MMITLIYAPADEKLARRIEADLAQSGLAVAEKVALLLWSPDAASDASVNQAVAAARADGQRILPIMAQPARLPTEITAEPVDFTLTYNFNALKGWLLLKPVPSNRRTLIVLVVAALLMFAAALYMVGVGGIQAPEEEYNAISTEAMQTIQVFLERNLPHNTQEAANFPATLEHAPTAQRPLLIATATARAGE